MRTRDRAALLCHTAVAVGLVGGGARYLLARQFLPYHAEVVGSSWAAVDPGLQRLILAALHGAGASIIAGGLALLLMLAIPWRRGERWARHGVPALALVGLVPLLVIALGLASAGAGTPWMLIAGANAVTVVGWGLSLGSGRPATERAVG